MVSSNDVTPLEKGAAFREPPGTALIKKDRQKFNKSPGSQRLHARVLLGPFVEFLEQPQAKSVFTGNCNVQSLSLRAPSTQIS